MSIEDGIKAIEAMIESGRLKVDTAAILAFREDLKRAESKIDAHLEAEVERLRGDLRLIAECAENVPEAELPGVIARIHHLALMNLPPKREEATDGDQLEG